MKQLFDEVSFECSKLVTRRYSTSFSWAVNMLAPSIRSAIFSIYGFVRFADEIVDSFHGYDKQRLIDAFEDEYTTALTRNISLNPIINSFQQTVKKYNIDAELVQAFLDSMKLDLEKNEYDKVEDYKKYIYGSADVVGLMCLKVFVNGDQKAYEALKEPAMSLGSAFQKVNFLRDFKDDKALLNRSYFPNVSLGQLSEANKKTIIDEIEHDFKLAYEGIKKLPLEARFGVYLAYVYYKKLLSKLKYMPSERICNERIRISNVSKFGLLLRSFIQYKLQLNNI